MSRHFCIRNVLLLCRLRQGAVYINIANRRCHGAVPPVASSIGKGKTWRISMKARMLLVVSLLAVALTVLVACGDDGDSERVVELEAEVASLQSQVSELEGRATPEDTLGVVLERGNLICGVKADTPASASSIPTALSMAMTRTTVAPSPQRSSVTAARLSSRKLPRPTALSSCRQGNRRAHPHHHVDGEPGR